MGDARLCREDAFYAAKGLPFMLATGNQGILYINKGVLKVMFEVRDDAKDYTPQERLQILREGQDTDVVSTCEKYNITRVAYYQWKKDFDETIERLWGKKKVGRKPKNAHIDLDELKKENESLKKEIEKNKKLKELKMLENLPVEEALKRVTDDFIRESWSMKDKRKIAGIIGEP